MKPRADQQAFASAFTAYWLVKWLPLWGFSLIAVSCAYLGPLVYINNRELIDSHIANAQAVVNDQAHQLKGIAGEHTANATGMMKQYVDDYSAKAQEYMGRSPSPKATKARDHAHAAPKPVPAASNIKTSDFPDAPKVEPIATATAPPAEQHTAAAKEPMLA